ncbi:MAG: hypothetical protein GWN58_50650, partial [Anaerolineae bacterium]|nr:hypothetical protein [Anaerolineae bacterium]
MTHGDNDVIEKWSGSDGYPFVIRYLNRTAGAREGTIWAARYDGENNPAVSSKARINDGVFHHVAFVKRSSRLALYIDGVLEATVEDSTTGETKNEGPLFIGARGGRGNFFSG